MGANNTYGKKGLLTSQYYLDGFKTICQDYTQKYNKIEFLTFTDGLSSNKKYMLCVCYVQVFLHVPMDYQSI